MALTLEYMRDLVRNRLDDEDFEESFLDAALNQAQWKILNKRKLTFQEKSQTATLLTGTNTVTYPTDIKDLIGLRVIASGIQSYDITENYMDYADFQMANYDSTVGESTAPLHWTTFGNQVIFPANADKDYTITFDYVKKSGKVNGVSVLSFDIPDEYEELLMIGAYMRIAKREDDYDVKQQEKIDYDELLTDLISNYTRNLAPRRKHVMRVMGR